MKKVIPKGSQVFNNGKHVAELLNELHFGDLPNPKDFKPLLQKGLDITDFEFYYEGKLIYKHPNFI